MPSYAAFLGHQPSISLAELTVLLPDMKVLKCWGRQIVTFETSEELGPDRLADIGGTVLIARALPAGSGRNAALSDAIPAVLYDCLKHVKGKATFSFRCFGVPRNDIRSLYRVSKTYLKGKGMPSRYIGNERNPAKPGTLMLRGIPGPNSCELVILAEGEGEDGKRWIGRTVAAQDIAAYTDRDIGKPFRDTRTGLMPPKLAQVMLNLALLAMSNEKRKAIEKTGDWRDLTVWDPFCGSGVIALEALRRRAHALASDRTERAVTGCSRNIRWFRDREKTPKTVTHAVWKQSALKAAETARKPDVIVTETSLGPATGKPFAKSQALLLVREAEAMEAAFFANMAESFPAVPIVCAFPVYVARSGDKYFLAKVIGKIEKLGYRLTCVNNPLVQLTERHTLLYLRPDQHVGREIACFLPPGRG